MEQASERTNHSESGDGYLGGPEPVSPGGNGNGGNGRSQGGGSVGPLAQMMDVNGDGRLDLLLQFLAADMKLGTPSSDGTSEAILFGETWSGDAIHGSGTIRMLP